MVSPLYKMYSQLVVPGKLSGICDALGSSKHVINNNDRCFIYLCIPLSPFSALKKYLNSFSCISDRLWINPHNDKIYNIWDLSKVTCWVINKVFPGSNPKAHQVRSCVSSIAFLRSFDLTTVQSQGQILNNQNKSSGVNLHWSPFQISNFALIASLGRWVTSFLFTHSVSTSMCI